MNTPSPQAERNIKTAAAMIREGCEPEAVLRFVYLTGHTDGALEIAKVCTEQLSAALKAAA